MSTSSAVSDENFVNITAPERKKNHEEYGCIHRKNPLTELLKKTKQCEIKPAHILWDIRCLKLLNWKIYQRDEWSYSRIISITLLPVERHVFMSLPQSLVEKLSIKKTVEKLC